MKNRAFAAFVSILVLAVLFSIFSMAVEPTASGKCGDNVYWSLSADGVLSLTGSGKMTNFKFASAPWMANAADVTAVTIADGIENIGDYSFQNCTKITEVILPQTAEAIGIGAFDSCSDLVSINIPAKVKTIGDEAFQNCYDLAEIDFAEGLEVVSTYAFRSCTSLTELTLPESVKTIGREAFSYCSNISTLSLPANLETLGEGAFKNCYKSLTELTLPEKLTALADEAFASCTALVTVTLPSSLSSFSDTAFAGCTSLEKFEISSENLNFKTVNGVLFNKSESVLLMYPAKQKSDSYTVPSGVTSISGSAFNGVLELSSLTLPSSLEALSAKSFIGADSLASVTVYPQNENLISENGVVYNSDKSTLILYPAGKTEMLFEIPASVGKIESNAFNNCENLKKIYFHGDLPEFGSGAFNGAASGIIFFYKNDKNGWSSSINVGGAEYTAESFNEVDYVIYSGSFGEGFSWSLDADGVLTVKGSGEMPSHNEREAPWYSCSSLISSAVVEEGITSIGMYNFFSCTMKSVSLPESLTHMATGAFSNCFDLESIHIPANVTEMGYAIFACPKLESITVAAGNTAFSSVDGVLYNKDKTELIRYPSGKKDTSVTLPETVRTITQLSFEYSKNLEALTLPAGLEMIEHSAFEDCSALKSLRFLGDAPSFGYDIFTRCPSDLTLYYRAGKSGWSAPSMDISGSVHNTAVFLPYDYNGDAKENVLDIIVLAKLVKSGSRTEAELISAACAILF